MINWKGANFGPLAHGLLVWLLTDGVPVLTYLQDQLTNQPAHFDFGRFGLGLAAAVLAALLSAARNAGAVSLNTGTTAAVKGIQESGGSVSVATMAESAVTEGSAPNLRAGDQVLTIQEKPA